MKWIWRLGFCAVAAAVFSACVTTQTEIITLNRYEFDQAEMGSPFRIVLYAPNEGIASNAATTAFKRIAQINDRMTDYDSDSELSQLSRTSGQGRAVPVSPDLWRVLERAQFLAERSGGTFDATVGPYVNLWRLARSTGKLPDPARLAKARRSVGWQFVKMNPANHTVELLAPDMRLDLGGIAKGYAVDQAMRTLGHLGIGNALVSGGGDLAVSGPPPGKRGWRIELPPLDASRAPPARYILLQHAGLSTSGDLFQRLEINGQRYSHIVDPRTGIGLTDHSLVTVIAPDDFTADGLTKVMSVLPPKDALGFVKGVPGVYVRIVRQPGQSVQVYESEWFHKFYE